MADLDAIAARGGDSVHLTRAERDALVAAVRWAQNAPHHDGCSARFNTEPEIGDGDRRPYRCKCGRDEALGPFKEADRG